MTQGRWFLVLGAVAGAAAVVAGALGAHAGALDERAVGLFHTASSYQLVHAVVLCVVGLWWQRDGAGWALRLAGWSMVAGIVCFSGGLYALALGAPAALGPVTPFGGFAFIIGWLSLAAAAWRR